MSVPKTVVWRHLWREGQGIETVRVDERAARGTIDCPTAADPFRLVYAVDWDDAWHTRALEYRLDTVRGPRAMRLVSDGAGHWQRDGRAAPKLAGCLDADLWPTPFTNTLAIRRIQAAGQDAAAFRVAWVDAFERTVRAREQRYTRTGQGWRFESVDDGFVAAIEVDDDGLVVAYPELFERIYDPA